jgi:hypothetical protein
MILPDYYLTNSDPELALYQPHLSVLISTSMPHVQARNLLEAHFAKSGHSDLVSKVWATFITPWFGLPPGAASDKSSASTVFTPGQRVRTAVGDGQIVSVAKSSDSVRYLVRFTFGVGYVRPTAIAHLLPATGSDMDTDGDNADTSQLMSDDIQVLFATERIYVFVRLYILLLTMLYQAKSIADAKKAATNTAGDGTGKSGFSTVMQALTDFFQGKIGAKDLESKCRNIVGQDVYNFVVIPSLVESCAESLIKVANEDCLDGLYHCSQLKLKDLSKQRNLSLSMNGEAIYRIQIQSSSSQVFFSYLPAEVELQRKPLESKQPEPAQTEAVATETSDAKRQLETVETEGAQMKEASSTTVEPEQKRMKMDVEITESKTDG